MYKVDLNCDLGESYGEYTLGMDSEIIPYISSANIACGFHASDPMVMEKTVALARTHGISIGAHPGYPDLLGFGRRNMNVSPEEAKAYVLYQIGALYGFCRSAGMPMTHVKCHGALYNMAGRDYLLAKAICEGIYAFDPQLILLALSGSQMIKAAEDTGLRTAREVFADRNYEEDGSLVSRTHPQAVIEDEDEVVQRVLRMVKEKTVKAVTGRQIFIEADSICIHGDGKKALNFVKKIYIALREEGIQIVNLSQLYD